MVLESDRQDNAQMISHSCGTILLSVDYCNVHFCEETKQIGIIWCSPLHFIFLASWWYLAVVDPTEVPVSHCMRFDRNLTVWFVIYVQASCFYVKITFYLHVNSMSDSEGHQKGNPCPVKLLIDSGFCFLFFFLAC